MSPDTVHRLAADSNTPYRDDWIDKAADILHALADVYALLLAHKEKHAGEPEHIKGCKYCTSYALAVMEALQP